MPKDNTSLAFKIGQRREVAEQIGCSPVVLEAFAGFGILYGRIWRERSAWGAAIEKNADKTRHLARQRPDWIVARGDCAELLEAGFGRWIPFDVLDVDSWGSPWGPVLGYLAEPCGGERERAAALWIVATDGLPQKLQLSGGVQVLQPFVEKYGEKLVRQNYREIARELLEVASSRAGYHVAIWEYQERRQLAHWTAQVLRNDAPRQETRGGGS